MVDSAAVLLRERGAAGVTVDAVLLAGLGQAGDFISVKLERAAANGEPRTAVASFVRFWKRALVESGFRAGCPVVAVVVDGRRDVPGAVETVRDIVDRWHRDVTALLAEDGYATERAERLATLIVAAIEGAIILCRARGDVRPLDDVAAEIGLLLDAG